MRRPHLIAVPFHDGLLEVDRGRGPGALLAAAGIGAAETIEAPVAAAPEAARVFAIAARLADRVRLVRAEGALPLIVAGDCNSCLGTVAGCGSDGLGVVWLDAHADFDTPADSLSGSLDAMGLALLAGHGWDSLRATVPGLAPVEPERIVLLGARLSECDRLAGSAVRTVHGDSWSNAHAHAALEDLRREVARVYLHIDLDVLDPSEGIANRYSAPDGLSSEQLLATIGFVADRFEVAAAAITAYEPAADSDRRIARTGARVLAAFGAIGPPDA